MTKIFDGHNDVLTRLMMAGGRGAAEQFLTGLPGALDLPRARTGGFAGGFFAIWVPSPAGGGMGGMTGEKPETGYAMPLPAPLDQAGALPAVMEEAGILLRLEELGALRICRSVADIRAAMAEGVLAAILHVEGAEAIDADLNTLDLLHAAGLRSLGPVWSRSTIFGHGVPFAFPSTGDIGAGLTEAGRRLVARCDALGIMLDLSHLNERGFWDVAELSGKPLVATHSNAHAVCPHSRNLTDAQLDAIAASDGMVGLNFATAFLREDGKMRADTGIDIMLRHLDHLLGRLGEDRVGMGSDYDGAVVPRELTSVAGLPALVEAMRAHGYGETLIDKLCHGNWLRVLERVWGG